MTQPKKLVILGATGSIGQSTLNVVRQNPDLYHVYALSGHSNMEQLAALVQEFSPDYAIVTSDKAKELQQLLAKHTLLPEKRTEIIAGARQLIAIAQDDAVDIVVAGIVGKAGLESSLAAAVAGKRLLLANKESLVMAGPLFRQAIETSGAHLLPIDSEHNAIFQTLPLPLQQSKVMQQSLAEALGVQSLVLTASGGPFRQFTPEQLQHVTPEQACKHPNWCMGAKVSVDSASLMNKGLELIEACYVFGVQQAFIDVVIHPQSIVHSMVSYIDGTTLAHLSQPNMEVPIAHGLAWPDRHPSSVPPLAWDKLLQLDFQPLVAGQFPCFDLARQAMSAAETHGVAAPAVLNAANEIAVERFLQRQIPFVAIAPIVAQALDRFGHANARELDHLLALDSEVRAFAAALSHV